MFPFSYNLSNYEPFSATYSEFRQDQDSKPGLTQYHIFKVNANPERWQCNYIHPLFNFDRTRIESIAETGRTPKEAYDNCVSKIARNTTEVLASYRAYSALPPLS